MKRISLITAARFCGVIVAGISLFILMNWLINNSPYQINKKFIPMQFNTALLLFIMGICIIFYQKKYFTIPLALFAVVYASLIVVQHIFQIDLGVDNFVLQLITGQVGHAGRTTLNGAIGISCIATALILLETQKKTGWQTIIETFLGSVVISLGIISFLNYLNDVNTTYSWIRYSRMAFETGYSFIMVGFAVILLSMYKTGRLMLIVPIGCLVLMTGISFYISQLIKTLEDIQFQQVIQLQVNHAVQKFTQYDNDIRRAMERSRLQWRVLNGTNKTVWTYDSSAIIASYPTVKALEWVDSKGVIQWIVPSKYSNLIGKTFLMEPIRTTAFRQAQSTLTMQTTDAIRLFQGDVGYLTLIPLTLSSGKFDGAMVSASEVRPMIEYLFANNLLLDFNLKIKDKNQTIYNSKTSNEKLNPDWIKTAKTNFQDKAWTFEISPLPQFVQEKFTNIPLIALLFGLFTSVITALAVFFGLEIREKIRIVEEVEEKRRNAQEELKIHKDHLQAILDASHHAIIAINLDGTINLFNHAAERMLGYSANELVGKQTPYLLHDPDEIREAARESSIILGKKVKPTIDLFIQNLNNKDFYEKEWTYIRKDGKRFPVWLSTSKILDNQGRIEGYVGIAQDISERKVVDQLKSEFVSIVSHELRTPLTSIKGSLSIIMSGIYGEINPKIKDLIEIGLNNCERLIRLINDILDIQKIEEGQMSFTPTELDVDKLVVEAINANEGYAKKFNIELKVNIEKKGLKIFADKDKIIQVLTNLLSNAIKFSTENLVIITISQVRERARVAITNVGEGIPESFFNNIFQKFSQADASSVRRKAGSGLGLNISKAIIEKHGGTIDFLSGPKETTFYFDLPLYKHSLKS